VTRALAELSARELISDLGDFPTRIAIRRGDYPPDTAQLAELDEAILSKVGNGRSVDLVPLFASLASRFPHELTDHGALWSSLLELHTLGHLDVSQAPNLGQLTAIEVHSRAISEEIIRVLSRRQQLLDRELEELCRWFSSGECANEDFRAYFATDEPPQGTCATPECRCSSCWSAGGAEEQPPRLYEAFMATDLRPAAATGSHRRRSEQQLDGHVWHLLWHNRSGLGENLILPVLQGEDHYFNKTEGRRKRLWPSLLLSRVRGRKPGLRNTDLRSSLACNR
jgi:hypothetical protein